MNIAEFAKRCGLSPHTLRYYERIGLLGSVTRQANGHRTFGPRDVEWVEFVHRLCATGMGISGMLRYAELRAQGDGTLGRRQRRRYELSVNAAPRKHAPPSAMPISGVRNQ